MQQNLPIRSDAMKKDLLKGALAAILGMGTALSAVPATAYDAGDMILRAGLAGVLPTGDGAVYPADPLGDPPTPAGVVEADAGYSLGITFTWMATNNIGVEVLGAWPFTHDIDGKGDLAGNKIGEVEHLPPTVTLQYHFDTASNLHPYVGAGVNYTTFLDEDLNPALFDPDESLDLDSSWGLALQAGIDMEIQNNWTVGAAVWWVDIDTDATLVTQGVEGPETTNFEVEIDPWVFMLSVGRKF
jgi:outer membrane protein